MLYHSGDLPKLSEFAASLSLPKDNGPTGGSWRRNNKIRDIETDAETRLRCYVETRLLRFIDQEEGRSTSDVYSFQVRFASYVTNKIFFIVRAFTGSVCCDMMRTGYTRAVVDGWLLMLVTM